jgi:hypothetical protein
MASLMFSPGLTQSRQPPAHIAPTLRNEIILRRLSGATLTFENTMQCGQTYTQALLLRNTSTNEMLVSFRANRHASAQLVLPEDRLVDATCTQEVVVQFTPSNMGDQKVVFEVCSPSIGRLQIQLFATVVSKLARRTAVTLCITTNCSDKAGTFNTQDNGESI